MTKKRRHYWFTPPIDRNYYPAIGHAIVLWAFLETEIDRHINGLLVHPNTRKSKITDTLIPRAFNRRTALWRRLANFHFSNEALIAILEIIDGCTTTRKDRDRIAHGKWAVGFKGKERTTYSYLYRDGANPDRKTLTIDEIRDTAFKISLLISELWDFDRAHFPRQKLPAPRAEPPQ